MTLDSLAVAPPRLNCVSANAKRFILTFNILGQVHRPERVNQCTCPSDPFNLLQSYAEYVDGEKTENLEIFLQIFGLWVIRYIGVFRKYNIRANNV